MKPDQIKSLLGFLAILALAAKSHASERHEAAANPTGQVYLAAASTDDDEDDEDDEATDYRDRVHKIQEWMSRRGAERKQPGDSGQPQQEPSSLSDDYPSYFRDHGYEAYGYHRHGRHIRTWHRKSHYSTHRHGHHTHRHWHGKSRHVHGHSHGHGHVHHHGHHLHAGHGNAQHQARSRHHVSHAGKRPARHAGLAHRHAKSLSGHRHYGKRNQRVRHAKISTRRHAKTTKSVYRKSSKRRNSRG